MKISWVGRRTLALTVVACAVHAQAWALSASDYHIVASGTDLGASFQASKPVKPSEYKLVSGGFVGPGGEFVSSETLLAKSGLPTDGEAGSFKLMSIDDSGRIAFTGPYVRSCFSCLYTKGSSDFYGVMSKDGQVLFKERWSDLSDPKYRSTYSPDQISFTASGGLLVSWFGDSYLSGRTAVYDASFRQHDEVDGQIIVINRLDQMLTRASGNNLGGAPLYMLYALYDLSTGARLGGAEFDPALGHMDNINDLGQILFYNSETKIYTILQGPQAVPEVSTVSMWGVAGLLAGLRWRTRAKRPGPSKGAAPALA